MKILFLFAFFVLSSEVGYSAKDYNFGLYKANSVVTSYKPHDVKILNRGYETLAKYIQMIRNAKSNINLLNYMFVYDYESGGGYIGKILSEELVAKADSMRAQGKPFKVRILVDWYGWAGIPMLTYFGQQQMAPHGIEVKYYNPLTGLNPLQANYRDHRKYFVVDGDTSNSEMIIGGRSLEDACFELSEDYNYVDRDINLRGEIANSAYGNFMEFWNSEKSGTEKTALEYTAQELERRIPCKDLSGNERLTCKITKEKLKKRAAYKYEEADKLLKFNEEVAKRKEAALTIGNKLLEQSPTFKVSNVTFVSPLPDKAYGTVRDYINKRTKEVESDLLIENYSFVPVRESKENYLQLLKDGKRLVVLTNSYHSTDEQDIIFMGHKRLLEFAWWGAQTFSYTGKTLENKEFAEKMTDWVLWGVHSKTFVFDWKHTFISSYNVDARSDDLNAEAGVFVNESPEVAAYVSKSIYERIKNSWLVTKDNKYLAFNPDNKRFSNDGPKAEPTSNAYIQKKSQIMDALFSEWLY